MNGDAPASIESVNSDAKAAIPPKTTKQMIARRNELKAKSTLLLAILDEHLLKFHRVKDVKTLWEAIKFSQLEIHGEVISQQDVNLKLLRSLTPAWNTYTLIMQNKFDLDTLSMDDLYNNLKVYKDEIKGQSSSSPNSQNVAFVSSDNTSSTIEAVNTTHIVSAASSQGQASALTYADDVMCLDYHEGEEIHKENKKESRECRAPRSQRNKNGDNTRKVVPMETPDNALVHLIQILRDLNNKSDVFESASDGSMNESEEDNNQANNRYKAGEGYHAVPHPYTGNFMPPRHDMSFAGLADSNFKSATSETITSVHETRTSTSKTSKESMEKPKTVRPSALVCA
nr:hypothetical protein [Tanacetum cinerariifolium]